MKKKTQYRIFTDASSLRFLSAIIGKLQL